ncbi:MAG: CD225/dispanin family protein [Clostridiales bacterium]
MNMYCEKCGVKNNRTSEYCIGCGVKIKISDTDNNEKKSLEIKKIPNYLGQSIILVAVNLVFSCFFLGIIPLIFSIIAVFYSLQIEKKVKLMNTIEAEDISKIAKIWCLISFFTMILFIVLSIIIIIILISNNDSMILEYIQEYLDYVNGRRSY